MATSEDINLAIDTDALDRPHRARRKLRVLGVA